LAKAFVVAAESILGQGCPVPDPRGCVDTGRDDPVTARAEGKPAQAAGMAEQRSGSGRCFVPAAWATRPPSGLADTRLANLRPETTSIAFSSGSSRLAATPAIVRETALPQARRVAGDEVPFHSADRYIGAIGGLHAVDSIPTADISVGSPTRPPVGHLTLLSVP
jgi:hypothetical protein